MAGADGTPEAPANGQRQCTIAGVANLGLRAVALRHPPQDGCRDASLWLKLCSQPPQFCFFIQFRKTFFVTIFVRPFHIKLASRLKLKMSPAPKTFPSLLEFLALL